MFDGHLPARSVLEDAHQTLTLYNSCLFASTAIVLYSAGTEVAAGVGAPASPDAGPCPPVSSKFCAAVVEAVSGADVSSVGSDSL